MIGYFSTRGMILAPAVVAVLATAGCAGRQHLDDYAFGGKTIAVRYTNAPVPELQSAGELNDLNPPFEAVNRSPERLRRSALAATAQARFDTAAATMNFARVLAANVLSRATATLGATPTADASTADFVLDVDVEHTQIQFYKPQDPVFVVQASAVLRDAKTGREVWRTALQRGQGLAQFRRATGAGAAIGPVGLPHDTPVIAYQRLLETLAQYDAMQITDALGAPKSTAQGTSGASGERLTL